MNALQPITASKTTLKPRHEPFGRPTKYDVSIIGKIERYLLTVGREQTKLPKRVDAALMLDVDDETLIEWEHKYPDFSATLARVDRMQMSQLIDDGVYGGKEVNARLAQFLLSANHNLVEKTSQDITSGGDKLQPTQILIVEDKQAGEPTE